MFELEVWNRYDYPSRWDYVGTFSSVEEAVKEAKLQQCDGWRVISVEAES